MERMEQSVMQAERFGDIPELRRTPLSARGLVAFGQYVAPADDDQLRGQHGIYGAAAGLEILAGAVRRNHLMRPETQPGVGPAEEWRRQLLGTWLFLQHQLMPGDSRPPAEHFHLVLRQSQVLRALSAADESFGVTTLAAAEHEVPPTEAITPNDEGDQRAPDARRFDRAAETRSEPRPAIRRATDVAADIADASLLAEENSRVDEWEPELGEPDRDTPATGDLRLPAQEGHPERPNAAEYAADILRRFHRDASTANRLFAQRLLEELERCRVLDLPAVELPPEIVSRIAPVSGYKFASTSDDLPARSSHWAFLEAATLVAVMRCAWTRGAFIREQDMGRYWTVRDTALLYEYVRWALEDVNKDVDFRVGLFAGWALLHLDPDAFNEGAQQGRHLGTLHMGEPDFLEQGFGVTRSLSMDQDERQSLRQALRKAVIDVLREPVRHADLHVPYFFKDRPDGVINYRQEHFVVPTVAILLSLLARTGDGMLFRPSAWRLVDSVLLSLEKEPIEVVTGQISDANGTVNFAYLHEALGELHDVCKRNGARSLLWRLRTASRSPFAVLRDSLRRHARGTALGIVLGVSANFLYDWIK